MAGEHPLSVAPEGDRTVKATEPFCGSVEVRLTVHVLLLGTGDGLLQEAVGAPTAPGNVASELRAKVCDPPSSLS